MIQEINKFEKKRPGNWLPADRSKLKHWVDKQIKTVVSKGMLDEQELKFQHKEVEALKELIENDAGIYILTNQMIAQALEYDKFDPTGSPEITDYQMMLALIDHILTTAPEYVHPDEEGYGLIGFPINAILDWCMGTPAGFAFFLNNQVNECFRAILNRWCEFLDSDASLYVLNTGENGWMCDSAKEQLHIEQFIYNPDDEHWGFTSWNNFFTREFKDGMRPIAEPDNPKVIVSACESAPYHISKNVQKDQQFWLKGQPYSLEYMMAKDEYVDEFIGGTIYQAFLSATKYHRWHSPVSGKIIKAYVVPGTYYSEIQSYPYDDAGPNNSQGYITQVATRAIIFIESDNPTIGLMCFMAVGMAEVSSCKITVNVGDSVKKGDQLGCFQFGGSTHCLIFRKDVIEQFVVDAIPAPDFNNSTVIKVNSKLAVTY
ncbi:MAG: phosphatidylserine decarboxylase family protein [Bacillota bacterium]